MFDLTEVKYKGKTGYITERHMTGGVTIVIPSKLTLDPDLPPKMGISVGETHKFVSDNEYEIVSA